MSELWGWGGGGEVGPQMNKFEQVSSDDNLMLPAGGGYVQEGGVCPEGRVDMSRKEGGTHTM